VPVISSACWQKSGRPTRRLYYERTGSPLWKIIRAAADVIEPA
jgi:hypothetical protein